MGSIAETNLDVLRRRTQVDWDCLDLAGIISTIKGQC